MNYITRLRREKKQQSLALRAARKALDDIRGYVLSNKFHDWPYVNVCDILARCVNGETEIDFHEALCAGCGLAAAGTDLICADCAEGIEYGKRLKAGV